MAATVNKRQAARNERTLQDLVRNVPGNDRCADCSARNPGWASWSLGIFLCMRCASIHRKLGVHVSKVKSLSMDTWTTDQVDQMKTNGNTTSNQKFNPRNTKPNLPIDADEIDIVLEKFIRQKYQTRILSVPAVRSLARTDTGSTGSSDERPPQVPAKDSPRSSSSSRALSSTHSAPHIDRPLPPIDESRGPGRPINELTSASNNATNEALARLKSMGFANERRNIAVLKGVSNDFDRAVQTLLRLGEGGHASETLRQQYSASQTSGSQRSTATTQTSQNTGPGAQIQSPPYHNSFHPQQTASPVDTRNSFNPQNQQQSPQATPPIEASFPNLSLSQPSSQPQSTGSSQNQPQNNPFLKAFTPPIFPAPYQQPYGASQPPVQYQQPQYQLNDQTTNPFLRHARSQNFMTSNDSNPAYQPSMNTQSASTIMPPTAHYAQQQYRSFSQPQLLSSQTPGSAYSQSQQQQQQLYPQNALYSPPVQTPLSQNTQSASGFLFQTMPIPQQNHQQHYIAQQPLQSDQNQMSQQYNTPFYSGPIQQQNPYQNMIIPQQLQPQQTGRHTKSSILALYNTPNPITAQSQPPQLPQPQRSASMPLPTTVPNGTQLPAHGTVNGNSNNIPSPSAQSRNPFGSIGVAGRSNGLGHIREESREFTVLNGRHSPDAFVGLSARAR